MSVVCCLFNNEYFGEVPGVAIMTKRKRVPRVLQEGTYYDTSGQVHISPIGGAKYAVHQIAEVNYGNDFVINSGMFLHFKMSSRIF